MASRQDEQERRRVERGWAELSALQDERDQARRVVEAIVARVAYPGKEFRVGDMGDGFYVQIRYDEPDIRTGEVAPQGGRKWYVSRHATHSEVVQTCFQAVRASSEHQDREHFTYVGSCPTCEGRGLVAASAEGPYRAEVSCEACGGSGLGKPRAIFGPHFDSNVLYSICGKGVNYDARDDPS